ncbi:hypothetical protein EB796_008223 [Bugula neritina]|uniref:DCAF17 n=1 Tax=Bugula neritina TaxID=10212 RepID=A0A7J7K5J3_BUGNE|nr:hypothetical protein EB796_008223 [Bugula neritina]
MSEQSCTNNSELRRITPVHVETTENAGVQRKPKKIQILDYLREVEGQCRSLLAVRNSRKSSRLMRTLVTHPSYEFKKIAEYKGHSEVYYEQNCVYHNSSPALNVGCYSVSKQGWFQPPPHSIKIKSYLYVQSPHHKTCSLCYLRSCCQPSILALGVNTRNSMVTVLHFDIQKGYRESYPLFNNQSRSFRSTFSWNIPDKTLYVSHKLSKQQLVLHLFSEMQGCQYIQDVDLFSDMLILQQKGNKVTLYNVHDRVNSLCKGDVSVVQIQKLSDLPPPLISVTNCDDFDLQIGGFPYSLLVKENGNYKVKPVENDDTLSGALIPPIEGCVFYEDSVMFDETESGHIIQRGPHSIRMYKVPKECSMWKMLTPVYPPVYFHYSAPRTLPRVSSSGRTLTNRLNPDIDDINPTILYELDILYTLSCDHNSQSHIPSLYLNLLDSANLTLLKSLPLNFNVGYFLSLYDGQYMLEPNTHISVAGDRDLLIVKCRKNGCHHIMAIYQLYNVNNSAHGIAG